MADTLVAHTTETDWHATRSSTSLRNSDNEPLDVQSFRYRLLWML